MRMNNRVRPGRTAGLTGSVDLRSGRRRRPSCGLKRPRVLPCGTYTHSHQQYGWSPLDEIHEVHPNGLRMPHTPSSSEPICCGLRSPFEGRYQHHREEKVPEVIGPHMRLKGILSLLPGHCFDQEVCGGGGEGEEG